MEERLQKLLSHWGIASRRRAEELIRQGRVSLNGSTAELGAKAHPGRDRILVDGRIVNPEEEPQRLYILLNKPAGVVSTCRDTHGRPTVLNLLPPQMVQGQGLHPVGRLDVDSTGALLLTNDGDLTYALTHPRYHVPKTYQVWVQGSPSEATLQQWRDGVILDQRKTLPARVKVIRRDGHRQTQLEVVLTEGRNRQIRRIADQLGYPVTGLHRAKIASVELNNSPETVLPPGCHRCLTESEINALQLWQTQLTLKSVGVRSKLKEHSG
ncbi:rRNA pseudouridine synthase [Phormidium yuhuli AB48]|uniref:Pseudouridine synthase n=1 Tax=Phormidium yuhuli AB48 TaxID=2940671 RepID=A0ABY5AS54_9CYAN|nr:pseudouridine synthase [Phormidium yuhuli]USR92053.1 rRNA pseudouridine synthase [Phormidium yuhuli AB48]